MKKILLFLGVIAAVSASVLAGRIIYTSQLTNEPGLTYSNQYVLNTEQSSVNGGAIDLLSAELVSSSVTLASMALTDGHASTGNLTVNSLTSLGSKSASDYLTVVSTNGLIGQYLTLNGIRLNAGYDFPIMQTTSDTAVGIMNAFNSNYGYLVAASTGAGSTVYSTATASAMITNTYTLASSTAAITVNSAYFTGGRDNAGVAIAGNWIYNQKDWFSATTASGTAKAISDAFMANSAISAIVVTTWTAGGVVYATSSVSTYGLTSSTNQLNFSLRSSDLVDISTSGPYMTAGATSNLNSSINGFFSSANGLTNGYQVLFSTTGSNLAPTGLVTGTTYYAIVIDANNFQLASSQANSTATIPVPIKVTQNGTFGGNSFTLAPLALTGTPSAKWEFSNDNVNWVPVNVASVTSSVIISTTMAWDLSWVNYRYYRFNVTAPTTGAIKINLTMNGKSED